MKFFHAKPEGRRVKPNTDPLKVRMYQAGKELVELLFYWWRDLSRPQKVFWFCLGTIWCFGGGILTFVKFMPTCGAIMTVLLRFLGVGMLVVGPGVLATAALYYGTACGLFGPFDDLVPRH